MITEKIIYIYRNVLDPQKDRIVIPDDLNTVEFFDIAMSCSTLLWFINGAYYYVPQPIIDNLVSLIEDGNKIIECQMCPTEFSIKLSSTKEVGPIIIPLV